MYLDDFNDLLVDPDIQLLWEPGGWEFITSKRWTATLASHAGMRLPACVMLSREEIFTALRGIEYDGQDRSIDVRVSRIRPKIGDDPIHPRRIKTVRSKGYLFVKEA